MTEKAAKPARKKSQKRQRAMQIKTPCTLEEFNAVAAKADAAGMSRAAYSRTVLLGDPGPRSQRRMPADAQALRKILGELGRVGNNINQIAFTLNRGDMVDLPEIRRELNAYAAVRNQIYAALGKAPE